MSSTRMEDDLRDERGLDVLESAWLAELDESYSHPILT